jgi:hypothetical protein
MSGFGWNARKLLQFGLQPCERTLKSSTHDGRSLQVAGTRKLFQFTRVTRTSRGAEIARRPLKGVRGPHQAHAVIVLAGGPDFFQVHALIGNKQRREFIQQLTITIHTIPQGYDVEDDGGDSGFVGMHRQLHRIQTWLTQLKHSARSLAKTLERS